METNFFEQVKNSEAAAEHAREIQQTRIGGLGGSDAAMVLRIAERGLSALTATDTKRLCVMLGLQEPENWGGNAYTQAGHLFEEFAEQNLPFGKAGYEREKYMSQPLARNFKTFAHADFVTGSTVVECKFVQKPTDKVAEEYHAQLQWYYMLGAESVTLYHGQGSVEPFEVEEGRLAEIERDQVTIDALLAGIKLLDDAIAEGWRPQVVDKVLLSDTPEVVQKAFAEMSQIKDEETALADRKKAAAAILKDYVEGFGLSGIMGEGETKRQIVYTRASVSRTFDAAKFLKDHPEYNDEPQYWKTANRASFITLK